MTCSRQSSVIVFGPRTSSVFCCALNFRYLRSSLDVLSIAWAAHPLRHSGRSLAGYAGSRTITKSSQNLGVNPGTGSTPGMTREVSPVVRRPVAILDGGQANQQYAPRASPFAQAARVNDIGRLR
jgi:hypothetical protein